MSRFSRPTALSAAALAAGFVFSFAAAAAQAAPTTESIHVSGAYHSVTNGIPNYDGFDQFRDARGRPLPGWEELLRSPG